MVLALVHSWLGVLHRALAQEVPVGVGGGVGWKGVWGCGMWGNGDHGAEQEKQRCIPVVMDGGRGESHGDLLVWGWA